MQTAVFFNSLRSLVERLRVTLATLPVGRVVVSKLNEMSEKNLLLCSDTSVRSILGTSTVSLNSSVSVPASTSR